MTDKRSSAGTTEVRCYGCGSAWNNLDLAVAKRNDPKIISCCPERNPLDIDAWMERAVAAEQKLRALNEPQTAPDSVSVKLLEDIERVASYQLSGTSLQQKAQRFDLIRDKARAALALTRPDRRGEQ